MRLGEVTLEDWMPLHFSGITDGSTIQVLKPYVRVTILKNHGTEIFWRLERKDSIKGVKAKLTTAQSSAPMTFYLCYGITEKEKYQGVKEFHMLAHIGCFKNYGFQSF